ncbi:MAG: IPTL-CTERM sorting domain-containing protein, partial [Acidobacteriota bacterium]
GTNFWIGDYTGTNKAYYVSPGGVLLKTITLANCTGYCDGLEFFQGKLISNRVDGCCGGSPVLYDVYDTNGALLTAGFLSVPNLSTGIAFDGTNFYTSDINNQKLQVYNGTTGAFVKTVTITGMTLANQIEDLSADYSIVLGPPPAPAPVVQVPVMAEWGMILMSGLLAVFGIFALRRRMR